jgi:putative FmdB family regulatory protein
MPTYEYACKACGQHLEIVQSFKDEALTDCPACGGSLRKVFGSIGIAFKGSGFYKTDNRPTHKTESTTAASSSTGSSSTGSSSTGSTGSSSGDSSSGD